VKVYRFTQGEDPTVRRGVTLRVTFDYLEWGDLVTALALAYRYHDPEEGGDLSEKQAMDAIRKQLREEGSHGLTYASERMSDDSSWALTLQWADRVCTRHWAAAFGKTLVELAKEGALDLDG
jgi:hypothetical protein